MRVWPLRRISATVAALSTAFRGSANVESSGVMTSATLRSLNVSAPARMRPSSDVSPLWAWRFGSSTLSRISDLSSFFVKTADISPPST